MNKAPKALKQLVPVDLAAVDYDNSFDSLWTNFMQRKSYVEQLAKTEEGFPATGSYDISKLFCPTSLILNLGILYSIKMKVSCGLTCRNPWTVCRSTASISLTSR